jgi:hypothetical protein
VHTPKRYIYLTLVSQQSKALQMVKKKGGGGTRKTLLKSLPYFASLLIIKQGIRKKNFFLYILISLFAREKTLYKKLKPG